MGGGWGKIGGGRENIAVCRLTQEGWLGNNFLGHEIPFYEGEILPWVQPYCETVALIRLICQTRKITIADPGIHLIAKLSWQGYLFKSRSFFFASEPGERDDLRRVPGERGEAGQEGQDQGRQQAQEEPQSSWEKGQPSPRTENSFISALRILEI